MAVMAQTFDICIRGTGIVGTTLALLLARDRLKVALLPAPAPRNPATTDVRAYALNRASRQLLESLRSWPDDEHATPVRQMQVRDERAHQSGLADAGSEGEAQRRKLPLEVLQCWELCLQRGENGRDITLVTQ